MLAILKFIWKNICERQKQKTCEKDKERKKRREKRKKRERKGRERKRKFNIQVHRREGEDLKLTREKHAKLPINEQ